MKFISYACVGALELVDAIRDGDGVQILQCWKFFFALFQGQWMDKLLICVASTGEIFILTPNVHAANRTVNAHGLDSSRKKHLL